MVIQRLLLITVLTCVLLTSCSKKDEFQLTEATISDIHSSFKSGELTSEQLVQLYLNRIDTYDQSTGINSIVYINNLALEQAKALDQEYAETGILRPMHGIPIIVKDNFNTIGLQTAAGSEAMKGFKPKTNAYQVQKLIEAGAIVIAKSNMAEWAFSPMVTISSLAGETLNPYNIEHTTAGSSGGTGASIAANFGSFGLGSDTGNSIRGPSSHNALVGFRSTIGLTSRSGIVPLYLRNDVGGPMARSVEDATRALEVIAGYDTTDPVTKYSKGKIPENYSQFLKKDGLINKRIGVLRILSDEEPNSEIASLFDQAIHDLDSLGAEIIDPFVIPDFQDLRQGQWCAVFEEDLNTYLAAQGEDVPVKNLNEVIESGKYADYIERNLKYFQENSDEQTETVCSDPFTDLKRIAFRDAIEHVMDSLNVDAIVYPSWNHPPARIGDFEGYKGDNSQVIAPHTGQPAFTVPMGFTTGNLPSGLQVLGRMFDEPTLIEITYAYEQGTLHRKPPKNFPDLIIKE